MAPRNAADADADLDHDGPRSSSVSSAGNRSTSARAGAGAGPGPGPGPGTGEDVVHRSIRFEDDAAHRSIRFEDDALLGDDVETGRRMGLRHRRSSLTNRLQALTEIGGVNSIRSFTRSWQRAAGFAEGIPQRPEFVLPAEYEPAGEEIEVEDEHEDEAEAVDAVAVDGTVEVLPPPPPPQAGRTSLLRQQLDEARRLGQQGQQGLETTTETQMSTEPSQKPSEAGDRAGSFASGSMSMSMSMSMSRSMSRSMSIFGVPPHLGTTPPGASSFSYASFRSYGTVSSDRDSVSPGDGTGESLPSFPLPLPPAEAAVIGEAEPILLKEVEQDGKLVLTVEGQSTLPQTIFNSINVLIGVGLLSLPLGLRYSGWLPGMAFLFLAAAVTGYTARLLARCMDLDANLISFSDMAYISFGGRARIATSILFTLELVAACVALVVLFADSLHLLLPGTLTLNQWKGLCFVVLIPLNFLPLRLLSYTSFIGILSCLSNGLLKTTAPGSLIEPAKTHMFPTHWRTLPLAFGLLMSPWGGHGVFPNIYRDMRHPHKYPKAVKVTFSFSYLLDATTAVAGLLMFGDDVHDEITADILAEAGYPRALKVLMCLFVAIIPLTKVPLNARPIFTTVEVLLGLHGPPAKASAAAATAAAGHGAMGSMGSMGSMIRSNKAARAAVCVGTLLFLTLTAVVFPGFDTIMALMGSALCFTICVTLPVAFTLKLFPTGISRRERALMWFLMVASMTLSVVGTVWAFLPRSWLLGDG